MMENCLSQGCSTFYESNLYKGKPYFQEKGSYPNLTKNLLDSYRVKQIFRVACGKSAWFEYNQFNPLINIRQVLDDEVVIEFDDTKFKGSINEFRNLSYEAINFTAINLLNAGITFEIWEHGGKSPHIHIHDLPIAHLDKDKRKKFKEFFIKKFVPSEYLIYSDFSLCGIHMIAVEWQQHWKGCYGIKRLLHKFEPQQEVAK